MRTAIKRCLLAGAVALSGTTVFSSDPATWGPIYADGPCKNLHQDECALTMQYKQQQAEERLAKDLNNQRFWAEREAEKKSKQEAQEKQKADWASADAKRAEESRAYWAKERIEKEAEAKAESRASRQAATATGALKAKCGDDYKSPRIGMLIERVRACVTAVKMTAQLSRADGFVTTYEGGGAYFHVMDGRVLSWGKY